MLETIADRLKSKFRTWIWNMLNEQADEEAYLDIVQSGYAEYEIDHMQEQANCALQREKLYVRVLEDYAKHQRKVNCAQRWFKLIFFLVVCVAFSVVVYGSVLSVLMIAINGETGFEEVAVAITSVVSLVSVIVVLPSKMAEHLFPVAGEKDITGFITKMHEMDTEIMSTNGKSAKRKKSEKHDDDAFAKSAPMYANSENKNDSIPAKGTSQSASEDEGSVTKKTPEREPAIPG